jgi:3-methylfumaryl-CoA hydratase
MSNDFSAWIGRSVTVTDTLDPVRCNALQNATAYSPHDEPSALNVGDPLPALYHWLHFWNVAAPSGLGIDGHLTKGGFLPPVSLPRRMWAGGRVHFAAPLVLGETVSKTSTIQKIEAKSGNSGDLVFVTIEHRIAGTSGDAIIEEQDIVYRQAASNHASLPAANTAGPSATWQECLLPDPVLLFRYSALTMNSHRIHYDRTYAIQDEGYPGLVVHGPLQATLLASLATRHLSKPIKRLTFRGLAPAFEDVPLYVCGNPSDDGANLWTEQNGMTAMSATAHAD